jgi:hypothetical protein
VGGQGTAAYREDHRTSLWGLHLHMVLADLSHYDRFCHGSYGINRIHMRSWILASTSSLDRLFLQSGELIIATTPCSWRGKSTGNYYNTGVGHRLASVSLVVAVSANWAKPCPSSFPSPPSGRCPPAQEKDYPCAPERWWRERC